MSASTLLGAADSLLFGDELSAASTASTAVTAAEGEEAETGEGEAEFPLIDVPKPNLLSIMDKARSGLHLTSLFKTRDCNKESKEGARLRRKHRTFDPRFLADLNLEDLFDFDPYGWSPIHYATFWGYYTSIGHMIRDVPELIEWRTDDVLQATPLHLAVMSGDLTTVKLLVQLGADLTASNSYGHQVAQLAVLHRSKSLIDYFLNLRSPQVRVWASIVQLLDSLNNEHAEAAASVILRETTRRYDGSLNSHWKVLVSNGLLKVACRVLKREKSPRAVKDVLNILINISERFEVKRDLVKEEALQILIHLMSTSTDTAVVHPSSLVSRCLCRVPEYAILALELGIVQALITALGRGFNGEARTCIADGLRELVDDTSEFDYRLFQVALGDTSGAVDTIVSQFRNETSGSLLFSLLRLTQKSVREYRPNQTTFSETGVAPYLVKLADYAIRDESINMAALEAIRALVKDNLIAQRAVQSSNPLNALVSCVRSTRKLSMQEKAAETLWFIAGRDLHWRYLVSERIGIKLMLELLIIESPILNYIGAESLASLAYAPRSHHHIFMQLDVMTPIVKQIRASRSHTTRQHILSSCLLALRRIVVKVGYTPIKPLQNKFTNHPLGGMKMLGSVFQHHATELIRAQAAFTLGCLARRNKEALWMVEEVLGVSLEAVAALLGSEDVEVQLLAGQALCAFTCKNPLALHRLVSVRCTYASLQPRLHTNDTMHQAKTAFEITQLALIYGDVAQSIAIRDGICTLTQILQGTQAGSMEVAVETEHIMTEAINNICGVLHTTAGIQNALIAVELVECLCTLMDWRSPHVRGFAAVATGHFSFNFEARRHLMRILRRDAYLLRVLVYYTRRLSLSLDLFEEWKHCLQIGVPPITTTNRIIVEKEIDLDQELKPLAVHGKSEEPEVTEWTRSGPDPEDDDLFELLDPAEQKERIRAKRRREYMAHSSQITPVLRRLSVSSKTSDISTATRELKLTRQERRDDEPDDDDDAKGDGEKDEEESDPTDVMGNRRIRLAFFLRHRDEFSDVTPARYDIIEDVIAPEKKEEKEKQEQREKETEEEEEDEEDEEEEEKEEVEVEEQQDEEETNIEEETERGSSTTRQTVTGLQSRKQRVISERCGMLREERARVARLQRRHLEDEARRAAEIASGVVKLKPITSSELDASIARLRKEEEEARARARAKEEEARSKKKVRSESEDLLARLSTMSRRRMEARLRKQKQCPHVQIM